MTKEELLKVAKPILFNTEMVKAILEGRKTVTRRLVKTGKKSTPEYHGRDKFYGIVDHLNNDYKNWYAGFYNDADIFFIDGEKHIDACYWKAPFKPGDILYVRETFVQAAAHIFWYKADNKDFLSKCKAWKPSIHMPKEAARIFLKVKNVRVERLQDITEEQATKEGCQAGSYEYRGAVFGDEDTDEWTAVEEFVDIWNSTIKKSDIDMYGWDANPYVWVIEFERIILN